MQAAVELVDDGWRHVVDKDLEVILACQLCENSEIVSHASNLYEYVSSRRIVEVSGQQRLRAPLFGALVEAELLFGEHVLEPECIVAIGIVLVGQEPEYLTKNVQL